MKNKRKVHKKTFHPFLVPLCFWGKAYGWSSGGDRRGLVIIWLDYLGINNGFEFWLGYFKVPGSGQQELMLWCGYQRTGVRWSIYDGESKNTTLFCFGQGLVGILYTVVGNVH